MSSQREEVKVAVIMGSSSDWEVMRNAVEILEFFEVPHEAKVISAHVCH
ncbi:5-(carboxyamino)imidazole ribonucleotide mutase [Oligella ureolytica]